MEEQTNLDYEKNIENIVKKIFFYLEKEKKNLNNIKLNVEIQNVKVCLTICLTIKKLHFLFYICNVRYISTYIYHPIYLNIGKS